jgi:hypothetical protein
MVVTRLRGVGYSSLRARKEDLEKVSTTPLNRSRADEQVFV